MAKQIVIIEDSLAHLQSFKTVFDGAVAGNALETADLVHFVFAHGDSHIRNTVVSKFPNFHRCENFEELRFELKKIDGNKLILLDVDLRGVHGFTEESFELSPEILSFYAGIVNANVNSCILVYSSGLQPSINARKLIEIGAREQSVSSIQKSPSMFEDAQSIVRAGLDLFFNNPLEAYPLRLKLQAWHGDHCSTKDFTEWFESLNVGGRYPEGTLHWLTSDWLRGLLVDKR